MEIVKRGTSTLQSVIASKEVRKQVEPAPSRHVVPKPTEPIRPVETFPKTEPFPPTQPAKQR